MFSRESEIFLWIKPKKKKKLFLSKVWINADVEKYAKRQEMFFCDEPVRLSDTRCYTTSHLQVFFRFRTDFLALFARISYFTFLEFRNLITQLFHSRLLDMRLVIANSVLRASLAIYHLISNARSCNNCQLFHYRAILPYLVKRTRKIWDGIYTVVSRFDPFRTEQIAEDEGAIMAELDEPGDEPSFDQRK